MRGVHGVAEGVEKRADAQRHVARQFHHVRRRHAYEFGERAVLVQAVDPGADADVSVAGAALCALAADDVHLGGDVVTDGQTPFVRALRAIADGLDESAELVAVDARRDD